MCTAATYQTECFYMGRTLDYEFSYGEEITITPREFPFEFRHGGTLSNHYAIIGMAHAAGGYPLYYDAVNEKGLGMAGLTSWATRSTPSRVKACGTSRSSNLSPGYFPSARSFPRLGSLSPA